MNARILVSFIALLSLLGSNTQAAPVGTAFTYQGKLSGVTNAANGSFDLKLSLYDALNLGTQVGSSQTNTATVVSNGYFTVTLDFGSVFDANARWLEIGVRTNGGANFTTLSPRQPLTPTLYSLIASNTATLGGQSPLNSVAVRLGGVLTLAFILLFLFTLVLYLRYRWVAADRDFFLDALQHINRKKGSRAYRQAPATANKEDSLVQDLSLFVRASFGVGCSVENGN